MSAVIRVLITDDSPTNRALLRAILEGDPELEVVGEARDGEEAVSLCRSLGPDVVTMDLLMPKVDGFEAIRRIMAEKPIPIIILTSPEFCRDLGIKSKANETGAVMLLAKPRGLPAADPEAARLISHLKAMAGVKLVTRRARPDHAGPVAPSKAAQPWSRGGEHALSYREGRVRLVAIGASTGGPPALQVVLGSLTADFPAPILVVQHMSLGFIAGLARWLDETTPIHVKVAEIGEPLRPGTAYLASDHGHLQASPAGHGWLLPGPLVDGHCPSATALFASVARSHGPSAIGVLLTGMGRDGAAGLFALRRSGALTIAQDESTSVVFGMPKEAIALGAAAEVLPLGRIGPRLQELVGRTAGLPGVQPGNGSRQ